MFVGMMFSGILFLFIVVVAIGLAANAVWRAVVPPAGLPRGAGCGSCGYELATLEGGRCSECGADLIKAGIATRRNVIRTAGSLPAALLGWTLLVSTLGVVVMYTVSMLSLTQSAMATGAGVAGGMGYTSNYTFRPARLGRNADGTIQTPPDFQVAVDLDVTGAWGSAANSGTLDLLLTSQAQEVKIAFADVTSNAWIMTASDGTQLSTGTGLNADNVLEAFATLGLQADEQPLLTEYADRVIELFDAAQMDPMTYESTYTTGMPRTNQSAAQLDQMGGTQNFGGMNPFMGTGSIKDYIVPLATLGVSVLVWIGGMIFIIRRRARLIEGPRAAVATV